MITELKENRIIRKILGDVEIETIIKKIKGRKLKQTEKNYLSRSIRPKLIAARILTENKIFENITKKERNADKEIIYNLAQYGYPLITKKAIKKEKKIGIEELIITILLKEPSPRFIEAIPILLIKNSIDKYKLAAYAMQYDLQNETGYLIETAELIAKEYLIKKDFKEIIGYLKERKSKGTKYLGKEKDREYMDFLRKKSPERIKEWNLLGRFFDEDFIKNGAAYL